MADGDQSGVWNQAFQVLERIAARRNELLILLGVDYVIGYAIWALHAWAHDLGPVPAADLQYLVAGAIPLGGAIVFFLLWTSILDLARKLLSQGDGLDEKLGLIALPRFLHPPLRMLVGFIASLTGAVLSLGLSLGVLALPLFLLIYARETFPSIPQEFGGGAPDCRYLELDPTAVTSETGALLIWQQFIDGQEPPMDIGIRSDKVDIYYTDGNVLYVKPRLDRLGLREFQAPTIQLPRRAVLAVLPCDFDEVLP